MAGPRANYYSAYTNAKYARRRQQAFKQHGERCMRCGSQDNLCFRNVRRITSMSEARWREVMRTLVIHCRACVDAEISTAKGTHGTTAAARYCRCRACKDAKNAVSREWKRRRRGCQKLLKIAANQPRYRL